MGNKDFLKKLQNAVNNSDPNGSQDFINRILDVDKMVNLGKDSKEREEIQDKYKDTVDEHYVIKEQSDEDIEKDQKLHDEKMAKLKEEEEKYKLQSDIANAKNELENLKSEFEDLKEQYEVIINAQENLITKLEKKLK